MAGLSVPNITTAIGQVPLELISGWSGEPTGWTHLLNAHISQYCFDCPFLRGRKMRLEKELEIYLGGGQAGRRTADRVVSWGKCICGLLPTFSLLYLSKPSTFKCK